ncbi:MAG TPA: Hsp20/alpha crystallin family protein [Anaerolineae bacterium]|nr:Hsp20/alpha crystallin family protein [Anaerolineae bacterium]
MSAITLWRPRRELLSLGESVDRFFDDWFVGPRTLWAMPTLSSVFPVDVYREDGSLVIKAEVPGVTSDELDITVKDNVLTISGETKGEEEVEEENYVRRERRYGSFSRSLALPVEAEGDKAEAAFEDGVLTVTIPIAEEPQPEAVKIELKSS